MGNLRATLTVYEPVSEGAHFGICVWVIDLGTQNSELYKTTNRQVLIGWELTDEHTDDGQPRIISKRYSLNLGDKATLGKDIQSWLGRRVTKEEAKDFDFEDLLGKCALVQVIHKETNDRTSARVNGLMPLPKGTDMLTAETPIIYFSFADGHDLPHNLPDWVIEVIKESIEYLERIRGGNE